MGGKGSGGKPRVYPPELVATVRALYESGQTIQEIQSQLTGCKVQALMVRCGIPRRRAIKRQQAGDANSYWRGDQASYTAVHLRVAVARGKPSLCAKCGATEGRFEWANQTGNYFDVSDYVRMCVSCHRRFDAGRRRATGKPTTPPGRVMSNV